MSENFLCNNCGVNLVDAPSTWCTECQRYEAEQDRIMEEAWFSRSALCQICANSSGPSGGDRCIIYDMPLHMVARKNRCKHYEEWR